jgi:Flp pilus assembly pilin Flp
MPHAGVDHPPIAPRRLRARERGQAATEYVLLVALAAALLFGIDYADDAAINLFTNHLSDFYRTVTHVVCLPLP